MTPALAQPLVLPWATTRALTVPSAATFCDAKRNWSAEPQMSPPPPWTVHVPPLVVCVPAGGAPPMSWHTHRAGQGPGNPPAPIATPLNVTVDTASVLCEVTARPARSEPLMPSDTPEPATG